MTRWWQIFSVRSADPSRVILFFTVWESGSHAFGVVNVAELATAMRYDETPDLPNPAGKG